MRMKALRTKYPPQKSTLYYWNDQLTDRWQKGLARATANHNKITKYQ